MCLRLICIFLHLFVQVHALLLSTLRNKLPMFGKEGKKKQLISQLAAVYQQVSQEYGVPIGDFPPVATMQVPS